jgi:hypothetical protein
MQLAEMTIPVELGGKTYTMYFNANCMAAYEQSTGKFFMDTVASLYAVIFPKGHEDAEGAPVKALVNGLDIVRRLSMIDLRALLWSSLHSYDDKGDPVWPLTEAQVGRLLNFQNLPAVFVRFLTGVSSNMPTEEELGESQAVPETKTATAESRTEPPTRGTGGEAGIVLPAGALD